ncbi:MAG: hypothetical protein GEV08_25235 [Acidimicrobiia bacterium]|nr:hypothetical protein [Acidimicrobiia bacterium]
MVGMLAPYRVLDLTDERGQLAGFLLAQLGADVVLVEPPGGSPARRGPLWWDAYARGKRSVVLDLESEAGRQGLRHLATGVDVVIESAGPGALDRLDLGPEALAEVNPELVYVSITPFGWHGPKATWAATDLVVQAAGGQMAISGDEDRAPVRISLPQAMLNAAVEATGGALAALWERACSGRGQHVVASAQEAMLACTQSSVLAAAVGAAMTRRAGSGPRLPPLNLRFSYPAADGFVTITHVFGASVGPFTRRLMEWVYEEGFCDEAMRDKDWVEYGNLLATGAEPLEEFERAKEAIAALTATKTKAELLEAALARKLVVAPVLTVPEVLELGQLAERGYWEELDGALVPGAFVKASGTPLAVLGPAPTLGADTEALLGGPAAAPGGEASPSRGGVAGRAEVAPSPGGVAGRAEVAPSGGGVSGRTGTATTADKPLAGLKVLDFMWAVAGPTVTRALADLGATVVRLESPGHFDVVRGLTPFVDDVGGPDRSAQYHNMNAGKLGLCLDVANPAGREAVLDLVRWADVVTESFSPGVMARLGLGWEDLSAVNPRLVMFSTCLMGQWGPLSRYAGFGNLSTAMCGFNELTGWPDRPPTGPYSAYLDYLSPRFGEVAVLAAADHARRTGQGQYLDFSHVESALQCLTPGLLDWQRNGRAPTRLGNEDAAMAPHGVYATAGQADAVAEGRDDAGHWVAVACANDAQWRALCGELGRGDLDGLGVEERLARRAALDRLVATWCADRTADEAQEKLQARGVPAHRILNSEAAVSDPHLVARGHWVTMPFPETGAITIEGPRVRFSRSSTGPDRLGPGQGEHAWEVLNGLLGYDADRIAELVASEALG